MLKYPLLFIILVLVQVLIFNHMVLFGVAFPFIFIYFILVLPLSLHLNWLLTLSFLLGFCIDVFSDTLGLNSLCCVLLAILRLPVFYAYVPKEDKFRTVAPTMLALGWNHYMKYSLTLCTIYCFLISAIEFFNFYAVGNILVTAASSSLFTFFLILGIDALFQTRRES